MVGTGDTSDSHPGPAGTQYVGRVTWRGGPGRRLASRHRRLGLLGDVDHRAAPGLPGVTPRRRPARPRRSGPHFCRGMSDASHRAAHGLTGRPDDADPVLGDDATGDGNFRAARHRATLLLQATGPAPAGRPPRPQGAADPIARSGPAERTDDTCSIGANQ